MHNLPLTSSGWLIVILFILTLAHFFSPSRTSREWHLVRGSFKVSVAREQCSQFSCTAASWSPGGVGAFGPVLGLLCHLSLRRAWQLGVSLMNGSSGPVLSCVLCALELNHSPTLIWWASPCSLFVQWLLRGCQLPLFLPHGLALWSWEKQGPELLAASLTGPGGSGAGPGAEQPAPQCSRPAPGVFVSAAL